MSDIEDGFCLPHNDTKFPSQPTELDKAIKAAERTARKYPLSWGAYLGQYFMEQLLLAAKRLKEVEKAKDYADRMLAEKNITANTFMNQIKMLHQEQHGIRIACQREFDTPIAVYEDVLDLVGKIIDHHKSKEQELSDLRAEYKNAVEAIDRQPHQRNCILNTPYPFSGSARLEWENLKCTCWKSAILSTPSAIAAMKGD